MKKMDELLASGVENLSDEDKSFFLKCFGLYFKDDGKFMIRLRIPAQKQSARYQNIYFNHQIACAGTATSNFGVIPNKINAIDIAKFLSKEVPIKNAKVRMYWSGCVKGCSIHSVADIGFEWCKAKDENGEICFGVHILLGGYATKKSVEARVVFKSVPFTEAKHIVKKIMLIYKNERSGKESFESFYSNNLDYLSTDELVRKISL